MATKCSKYGNIGDQVLIPLFEDQNRLPNNTTVGLDRSQSKLIREAISSEGFDGKRGCSLTLWTPGCRIHLLGLGQRDDFDSDSARVLGARFISSVSKKNGISLTTRMMTGWTAETISAFVEGVLLRDYEFIEHQDVGSDYIVDDWELDVQVADRNVNEVRQKLELAEAIVSGVHLCRDLGNEPANVLYPMEYANRALSWAGSKANIEVEVYDWDRLHEVGMGGLINVGKGSDRKPCMVIFTLNPDKDQGVRRPCIVGKGITFDTGGISIKPTQGMWDMKYDMCGAATVFGLMQALHASGYERRVNGIACLAENMPGSGSYRPGDVFQTYSGKTVEVYSTDAEGRNVLADGLWKAADFDPEYIVDLATLTGAVVVALGNQITGMWSNDESLAERVEVSAKRCGEPVWRMPLNDQFRRYMTDTPFADIRNGSSGGRAGSSNGAAAFLEFFVPPRNYEEGAEKIPWVHLDIAGTAWGPGSKAATEQENPFFKNGSSGVHVRTLFHLIADEDA
ncbi:MAG: leucyl aminopeptidase [Euryarchaeota archaeon]|jgi:leucyl aminopeptidase